MKETANYVVGVLLIIAVILGLLAIVVPGKEANAAGGSNNITPFDGVVTTSNGILRNYFMAQTGAVDGYVRFINRYTNKVWNSTTGAWGDIATTPWADTNVEMSNETQTSGSWKYETSTDADFMSSNAMWCDMLCYDRAVAAAIPAYTDAMVDGGSGQVEIFNGFIMSFDRL